MRIWAILLVAFVVITSSIGISYALTQLANDDVSIPTTKKLFLDGGGDTYISEIAPNFVKIFLNDIETLRLQETVVTIFRNENVGQLRLYGDRATQGPNDEIAQMVFRGNTDNGLPNSYGRLRVNTVDVTAGSHDGLYKFEVAENGILREYIRIDGGNEEIQIKKPLTMQGNNINLAGGNIISNGDICIGNCP